MQCELSIQINYIDRLFSNFRYHLNHLYSTYILFYYHLHNHLVHQSCESGKLKEKLQGTLHIVSFIRIEVVPIVLPCQTLALISSKIVFQAKFSKNFFQFPTFPLKCLQNTTEIFFRKEIKFPSGMKYLSECKGNFLWKRKETFIRLEMKFPSERRGKFLQR